MTEKKSILVYCVDISLLAATTYALRVRNYDATPVRSHKEVAAIAGSNEYPIACVVLLHTMPNDPAGRLIRLLLENSVQVPVLLVDRVGDLAPVRYANMVLYGSNTAMAHIFDALSVLCQKRSAA